MTTLAYIDKESESWDAILTYMDLKGLTENFNNLSMFENFPDVYDISPELTRIIKNDKCYMVRRIFTHIEINKEFYILAETD